MKYKLAVLKWTTLGLMALSNQTGINAQVQIGQDINGEEIQERTPSALSMPNPTTLGIASYHFDGDVQDIGRVKILEWDGNSWVQKGNDILGEATNDWFGTSLSMPDANTVGVGAVFNDDAGLNAGHARVFYWDGTNWLQKGEDLDAEADQDQFGAALSMPDPNTIGISGPNNDGSVSDGGHVRIFDWDGESWVQRGNDIEGQELFERIGSSVSMPTTNIIGIGTRSGSMDGINTGKVQVYEWDGSEWVQLGNTMFGDNEDDNFGHSIVMPNAHTIAVGAWGFDNGESNNSNYGLARVFTLDGSTWVQKGSDIVGEEIADAAGGKVFMVDEDILAVGAGGHGSAQFMDEGHVRIYHWTGSEWNLIADILGEGDADRSGDKIAMGDENTIAIGAQYNDNAGEEAGQVRVYDLSSLGVIDNSFETEISVYPNPTFGPLDIDLGKIYENISVSVQDVQGKNVLEINRTSGKTISLNIQDLIPGMYLLTVQEINGNKAVMRVLKN